MASFDVRINGVSRSVDVSDPDQPLLYALRDLGLTAAKFGCGLGQCGACNVLVDGRAMRSCLLTVPRAQGRDFVTLEGLGTADKPHALQTAFVAQQVPQCGYCTSGIIVSAAALLAQTPKPSEAEGRAALDGNLCRCGSHARVVAAVMTASGQRG